MTERDRFEKRNLRPSTGEAPSWSRTR